MIEIKHKATGEVLHRVDADKLAGGLFVNVSLSGADLAGADLTGAEFREATLCDADLRNANLTDSSWLGCLLLRANLEGAMLVRTRFDLSLFNQANLGGSGMALATFSDCRGLDCAQGLDQIRYGPGTALDVSTLRECSRTIPGVFLRGIGYTNDEIEILRAMYATPIYFSCFISYARSDHDFAQRLHNDLEGANVPCWLDVEDLRGGDFWRGQINEAIRLRDKTVLVCSEASLQRVNVVEEILATIADERRSGKQKLFPITIDHAVYDPAFQLRVAAALPRQQQREDWLTYVSDYHIPDFSGWKDHDAYQRAFGKLLRDLRAAAADPE